ncbi:MAG TPA: hypothetical protein VF733_07075 [Candidatus Saccharimonadales bacterium]
MSNLNLISVAGSGFEKTVEDTLWNEDCDQSRLRVAPNIGCLVVVNENERPQELVLYSSFEPTVNPQYPPYNISEFIERNKRENQGIKGLEKGYKVSRFNTDIAKGLGISGANGPWGLQHPASGGPIVARGLWLRENYESSIHMRSTRTDRLTQALRFLRHGALLTLAGLTDVVAERWQNNPTGGTQIAVNWMERNYGNAQAVIIPAPPSWRAYQKLEGIITPEDPKKILVRGGYKLGVENRLRTLGEYDSKYLSKNTKS